VRLTCCGIVIDAAPHVVRGLDPLTGRRINEGVEELGFCNDAVHHFAVDYFYVMCHLIMLLGRLELISDDDDAVGAITTYATLKPRTTTTTASKLNSILTSLGITEPTSTAYARAANPVYEWTVTAATAAPGSCNWTPCY
jgi:hypothetical protein